ncbi:MAG: DsbA family protein [Bdellovibrionota bacterium]|nr:hypothetical protein [Pseudobdellovibrionaceae bacterium]|tara:strand:+ start:40626 stop:41795 length:1170 start_codon:yes stop_codon:yes gene_type:complete
MEKKNKNIIFYTSLIFSAIAVYCLYYLAEQHWALKLGAAATESMCNLNATFNCDAVSASPFSSFFNIPIALWGAVSFGIFLVSFSMGVSANIPRLIRHSFYLSNFFIVMSVIMAVISLAFMNTYCLFCIATYVCSIIVFFCAKSLNPDGYSKFSEDIKDMFGPAKSFLAIYLLIPVLSFVFQDMAHGQSLKAMNDAVSAAKMDYENSRTYQFDIEPSYKFGASDENAKVIVHEFADFLCPHCKFALPTLKAFVSSKPDVQLRFYAFPLSAECNAAIGGSGPDRCRLARVSYCAEKEFSKGKEVTTELFAQQGYYRSSNVISEIAAKFSLDEQKLSQCEADKASNEAILAQAKLGQDAGIRGTPAIFINGKKLSYGARLPILNGVYEIAK